MINGNSLAALAAAEVLKFVAWVFVITVIVTVIATVLFVLTII